MLQQSTIFFSFFLFILSLQSYDEILLENLDYSNEKVKQLRADIKKNLKVSKSSNSNELLTPLVFFRYTVSRGDNFFKIMARTGMDIDTLSSVNSLSSPQDIRIGMKLLIPNMRGVYDGSELSNKSSSRKKLALKYGISENLPVYDKEREDWFLPGRTLSKLEKSYFYGMAFIPPLAEGFHTSGFGMRTDPFTKEKTFHGGVDIAAPKGTSVIASAEGEIIFTGTNGGYGKLVVIKHAMGYETRYGHLDQILIKDGKKVKRGEKIGKVGSTGRATGDHLHFEVRRFAKNQKPVFYKHL
jgi:murein DD-endopeptidase MepM/ murein hydrolase activator NlpD